MKQHIKKEQQTIDQLHLAIEDPAKGQSKRHSKYKSVKFVHGQSEILFMATLNWDHLAMKHDIKPECCRNSGS